MGKYVYLFASVLASMLVCSCSVKEDRSGCPCRLTVDFSRAGASGYEVSDGGDLPGLAAGGLADVTLRLYGNKDRNTDYFVYKVSDIIPVPEAVIREYEVPRGTVYVSAVYGDLAEEDGVLVIPEGEQMGFMYGYFKAVDTRREAAHCDVVLHKEFCDVSIKFGDEGYVCPYNVVVSGNVAGVSALDLLPCRGVFRYEPVLDEGGYNVRVPRQADDSLELWLMEGEETVEVFPLGKYIASTGYDWTAESLEDVDVEIDLARQEVSVCVKGWDKVVIMGVVI